MRKRRNNHLLPRITNTHHTRIQENTFLMAEEKIKTKIVRCLYSLVVSTAILVVRNHLHVTVTHFEHFAKKTKDTHRHTERNTHNTHKKRKTKNESHIESDEELARKKYHRKF